MAIAAFRGWTKFNKNIKFGEQIVYLSTCRTQVQCNRRKTVLSTSSIVLQKLSQSETWQNYK